MTDKKAINDLIEEYFRKGDLMSDLQHAWNEYQLQIAELKQKSSSVAGELAKLYREQIELAQKLASWIDGEQLK